MEHQRWIDAQSPANQVEIRRAEVKPLKESKVKRIFGMRTNYLIAGITLSIFVGIASLFLFPDWGVSFRALVIVFPVAFVGVTNFIANIRKAYE